MHKVVNIISLLLLLSIIGVYIYVFAVPWLKGTMVKADDPNCSGENKKCKQDSYCCRDPREGGAYCLSMPCNQIRLEQPDENKVKFFNIYSICVIGILVILAVISTVT